MSSRDDERSMDPPLSASGELELDAELSALADRLRGDALRVAEAAVPQTALARLSSDSSARSTRRTWAAAGWVTATVLAGVLAVLAVPLGMRPGERASDAGPRAAREAMRDGAVAESERARAVRSSQPELSAAPRRSAGNVFLSAEAENDAGAAVAESFATAEEKVRLLEAALERYRSAVEYQQDRLIEGERRWRAAEQEVRELRARLEHHAGSGGAVAEPVEAGRAGRAASVDKNR